MFVIGFLKSQIHSEGYLEAYVGPVLPGNYQAEHVTMLISFFHQNKQVAIAQASTTDAIPNGDWVGNLTNLQTPKNSS